MNASHSPAKLGTWTDYTTGETWYVTTAARGYVLPALVGVWLSFSAKYIKQVLANFALYLHNGCYESFFDRNGSPTERTPLLHGQRLPRPIEREEDERRSKELAKILRDGGGFRDLLHELFFNKDLHGKWQLGKSRFYLIIFIVFTSVINVGFLIGGVYVARIKATGPVKLDAPKCGLWTYDRDRGGDEAAARAGILDLEKEERAGEYAQDCYGKGDMFDAIECNFLYRKQLTFGERDYTSDCPFENSICGQNQTVTFKTDWIHASELGINSRPSPKFRRYTSCTPLSMEYPFIQNITINGTTSYYYYYGERDGHSPPVSYTYKTTGDPFDSLVPAYNVFAYTTNNTATTGSYWKPRSELRPPEFTTLTLIFISSGRILYKKGSEDPLFPSEGRVFLPGEQKPWFRNSDPRARPLACLNYIEVCLGDGKTCWPMDGPMPKDKTGRAISAPSDFWLMYTSLLKTDIYNSIEKRLGRGLIAQKMVSQYFSEGLSDFHWVDEVQNLVTTSHARTQINAWSVASGEDSVHEGKDGFTWRTQNEAIYGTLCGLFKFNPKGYANVRFVPFILIWCSFPLFATLSLKWRSITGIFESKTATDSTPSVQTGQTERNRGTQSPSDQIAQEDQMATQPASSSAPQLGSTGATSLGADPAVSAGAVGGSDKGSDSGSLHNIDLNTPPSGAEPHENASLTTRQEEGSQTPQPVSNHATEPEMTGSDETKWEPLLIGKVLELILWRFIWLLVLRPIMTILGWIGSKSYKLWNTIWEWLSVAYAHLQQQGQDHAPE